MCIDHYGASSGIKRGVLFKIVKAKKKKKKVGLVFSGACYAARCNHVDVIPTQDVIIAARCNTIYARCNKYAKCNNFYARCNNTYQREM